MLLSYKWAGSLHVEDKFGDGRIKSIFKYLCPFHISKIFHAMKYTNTQKKGWQQPS